jgi:poly-gamma-glutamate synthesis protein (capsule biosynthesis protein)
MRRVDLFLAGDVMTGRAVDQILPHPSTPELFEPYVHDAREYVDLAERANGPIPRRVDFAYPWGDVLDELRARRPDARIVNLETSVTVSDRAWPGKGIHYRMHPRNVPCLTAAEIDLCVLANNHVLDWGREGLVETLDTLHESGIETAGAGRSADEALRLARIDLSSDCRVLVAAFAERTSGVGPTWEATEDTPGVALLREIGPEQGRAIAERLMRERRPGDLCIASIHWGTNWGHAIPEEQVALAEALVDGGVDVVHGHSSHHPRAIEIYRDKPILYGCGDFLTDYEGISGHEEFRSDLVLMYLPSFDDGRLVELRMVAMKLRRLRLERAPRSDAVWLADTLARVSRPYGTSIEVAADGTIVARDAGRYAVASSAWPAR